MYRKSTKFGLVFKILQNYTTNFVLIPYLGDGHRFVILEIDSINVEANRLLLVIIGLALAMSQKYLRENFEDLLDNFF